MGFWFDLFSFGYLKPPLLMYILLLIDDPFPLMNT